MSTCRYDSEREDYLIDGEPCRHDDYGDPTKHCTARRTCSEHIGRRELTCARCVGRTRQHIRTIVDLYPLTAVQALDSGVNSEAANLAGPACDYRVFSARRNLDRRWLMDNIPDVHLERAMRNLLPDDDEWHPYGVLTRWHLMLAEDYGHKLPAVMSVSDSGAYLERMLPRMAHDDEQDFPLFAREIRKVQTHLESVIRNSHQSERGAPCPTCDQPAQRLTRQYGHFCLDPECDKVNYEDDSGDQWICPRNRAHVWGEYDYRRWVADVYEANRTSA